MINVRASWLGVALLLAAAAAGAEEPPYTVIEGQGIESVAMLGDEFARVVEVWGEPDSIAQDNTTRLKFLPYRRLGAVFTTTPDDRITMIEIHSNLDEQDLLSTFQGSTSEGLVFKDRMKPEDVYAVYGEPELTAQGDASLPPLLKEGAPFILDRPDDRRIYYPAMNTVVTLHKGQVDNFTITEFDQ